MNRLMKSRLQRQRADDGVRSALAGRRRHRHHFSRCASYAVRPVTHDAMNEMTNCSAPFCQNSPTIRREDQADAHRSRRRRGETG